MKKPSKSFLTLAKYVLIVKNTLQEYFTYRINFLFWRLRMFISFLVFYFLWLAISDGKAMVGNYTQPQLLTYFAIGYILRTLIFSTRSADLGGQIADGGLSRLLLRPLGAIQFFLARDIVDKLFNLVCMFFEFLLIILVFRPPLVVPAGIDFSYFMLSSLLAVFLFFIYSVIISLLTFWVDQAWSTRWLFGIVFVNLFSGQTIPLDLLPRQVFTFAGLTPFPYFYYYPMQFYLGKISPSEAPVILAKTVMLVVFTFLLLRLMWKLGIKKYQSYGG